MNMELYVCGCDLKQKNKPYYKYMCVSPHELSINWYYECYPAPIKYQPINYQPIISQLIINPLTND